jgi:hypothetical protein
MTKQFGMTLVAWLPSALKEFKTTPYTPGGIFNEVL